MESLIPDEKRVICLIFFLLIVNDTSSMKDQYCCFLADEALWMMDVFLSQQFHKYTENFQQDYATEKQQTSLESWNIEDFKNMRDIAVTLTIKKLCAQSWFQTFKLLTVLKVLMMLTKSFEKYLSFKNLIHQMTGFQLLKDNCSSLVPMPIAQIETWVAADCSNV